MSEINFVKASLLNPNVQAFLATIRKSEGAQYNSLFGDTPNGKNTFNDYSTHPDVKVPFRNTYSTAAGAYQILYPTWVQLCAKLGVNDFSPETQDLMAAALLSMVNCLQKCMDGDLGYVLSKACKIWASLPGDNGYDQPQHDIAVIQGWFEGAGGVIA